MSVDTLKQVFTDVEQKTFDNFTRPQEQLNNVSYLQIGSGDKSLKIDNSGIWLGAKKFADAPFSVNMLGQLVAYSALISGDVTLGGVDNTDGVLTVKDASNVVIIKQDKDGAHFYDATGLVEKFRMSSAGIFGYGTDAYIIQLKNTPADATPFGNIGYSSTYGMYLYGNPKVALASNDMATVISNQIEIFGLKSSGTGVSIAAPNGSADIDLTSADDVNINYGGDFKLNGTTKTAIVPTSKGYKALYCAESPNVWFFDFCNGVKKAVKWWKFWDRKWIVEPDPTFLEVTEGAIIVMPTLTKGVVQIWRARKGFAKTRFEKKTEEQFFQNNKFWNIEKGADIKDAVKNLVES